MSEFVLTCCSTADLSKEHFNAINVPYVCFHFSLNGETYPDDLGESIPFDKFYQMMAEGAETMTSQVNVSEFIDFFTPYLEEGKDILHLTLSSGLSGCLNSARTAAGILAESYPDRKIYIVDSLAGSSGCGLIIDTLAEMRDKGATIDELHEWVEENKLRLHHWFFSTDLSFYVKGGRITKAEGFFGTMLKICPLLNVDNTGHLIPREKIRTKKKVISEIVARMEQFAENGLDYSGKCYISQSACMEDAQAVAALVEERFPKLNGKVEINNVGTTIGSHTGPGTVALFFWGSERTE